MGTNKVSTTSHRTDMVKQFQSSGLNYRVFAERHGIKPNTFSVWLRAHRESTKSSFIPVKIAAEIVRTKSVGFATLNLRTGETLEIPLCADPKWVARLVGIAP